eukprot:5906292-Amphidinium_carterae.1
MTLATGKWILSPVQKTTGCRDGALRFWGYFLVEMWGIVTSYHVVPACRAYEAILEYQIQLHEDTFACA